MTLDAVERFMALQSVEHAQLLDRLTDPLGRVSIRRGELQLALARAANAALADLVVEQRKHERERNR